MYPSLLSLFFFFFNDTATTEIYTLSLHDALPISCDCETFYVDRAVRAGADMIEHPLPRTAETIRLMAEDRKSTRLNSSHLVISYAVFCLKKKTTRMRTSGCGCSLKVAL